jgi:hypothetical protein
MAKRKIRTCLPDTGDVLVGRYKGKTVKGVVVSVSPETSKVAVRIGKETFPSLSSAAKSITGNCVNGWVFWGLESKES